MPILISHNSALERLRSVPPQVDTATPVTHSVPMEEFRLLPYEITHLDLRSLGITQQPLHHLAPATTYQSKAHGLKTHLSKLNSLPPGLIREIQPGVYLSGPELCFIQMATHTSLLGAVVLGHELCGTYSHFSTFVSGFYERPALTSVAKIEAAIEQLAGMHGLSRARKALRWTRDGSASPMETVVSCMLSLPTSLGGFGLVLPTLNYKVTLDEASQRITKTKTARVDTAYVQILYGLEYDGQDYHRDAEKDRRRREALAHEGWTIFVVNVDEASDWAKLRDKVALLDKVPRQRGSGEVDEKTGRALLDRLLRATRYGVGMNAALFGVPVPRGRVKLHL